MDTPGSRLWESLGPPQTAFAFLLLAAACLAKGTGSLDAGPDTRTIGNGLIAFTALGAGSSVEQIFTVDPAGANRRQLTTLGANHFPSWSHDGRTILFASNRNGGFELYAMNADGSNQTPIAITNAGEKAVPRLSPDGSRLAFALVDPSVRYPEVWTAPASGGNATRLTHTPHADAGPTWSLLPSFSPDGGHIAYGSTRSGSTQIWVMGSDGSGQTQLTNGLGAGHPNASAPDWSPDGNRIALWAGFETQYGDVWLMNADGSNAARLTSQTAPISSDNPVWSPDGKQILFDTNRSGTSEIWVMNADGSGQRMLTSIGIANSRFSWQPIFK